MIKEFFKKNWQIFVFNALLLIVFILGYGRFGDVIVDSFREAYIPECILKGQILYKDIFTIYAPFAYLFNAFLFLIFGIKLKVLYIAGFLTTVCILNVLFKISNKFMAKTYGLGIILLVISASVLSPNVFNMFFPYSYGILYGLLFALLSIKFATDKKFVLSFLSYSFAICSKYEFILLFPALIWAYVISCTKFNIKEILKILLSIISPIILVFSPLFISGMRIENLVLSFQLMQEMSNAKTLHWFYSISGLIFRPELLLLYLINFLKIFIPVWVLKKINHTFVYLAVFVYLYFVIDPAIFIFAFPLILLILCINFKKLKFSRKFIVIASLLLSWKVFFATTMQSYGCYFIPPALLCLFVLLPAKYKKSFLVVSLMSALIIGIQNVQTLMQKNLKIETGRGFIYTFEYYKPIKEAISYISEKSEKTDMVVGYPELLVVNFLADRPSDSKFYSMIPLYSEIFGDDIVSARIDKVRPKYAIVSNYDTSIYGVKEFGKNYAIEINNYILSHYNLVKEYGNELKIKIFLLYN